jgi:hypothetical protein
MRRKHVSQPGLKSTFQSYCFLPKKELEIMALKGQPYILLIKMESKFHEMGISIRERKKWLLCWIIFGYEAL